MKTIYSVLIALAVSLPLAVEAADKPKPKAAAKIQEAPQPLQAPEQPIPPAALKKMEAPVYDMSVFGISLGQNFLLPECAKWEYGYKPGITEICFKRFDFKEYGPIANKGVEISFPISGRPSISKYGGLVGRLIDGNLEGVNFNTMGIKDAEIVLEKLTEKYGKPQVFVPRVVKNRFGASFEAFKAAWIGQNINVVFLSVDDSLDSGTVYIETIKGSDERIRANKEATKDNRPL